MPVLHDLTSEQIDEAISDAARRNVPLTVSINVDERWLNLHSRILAIDDGHVCISPPRGEQSEAQIELEPAQKVGLTFKLRHHKHIASARVAGRSLVDMDDGTVGPVVLLCCPHRMQRLQRRAFKRVEVPPNRIVRVSMWLGGCAAEPSGPSSDCPIWSGQVVDLSAGGVQLAFKDDVSTMLEVGDTVGLRMTFGLGSETVYADAQVRYADSDGDQRRVGFRFAGLAFTNMGRKALRIISAKVAAYERMAEKSAQTPVANART